VYRWARQNTSSYGGDPDKFFSIGGSAGGGLALAVANRITKNPDLKGGIKGCAAIVPVALHYDHVPEEVKSKYTSYTDNGNGAAIIDKKSMEIFFEHAGVKPDDADCFTALAKDNHKNFPPTYFAVCERDPLRDDGLVMEEYLKKAGVPTKLDFYKDLPHYFWIFPQIPEGQQFMGNLIGGVKWLLSQM
jgi:versiconal hemiacetal acetate esterase